MDRFGNTVSRYSAYMSVVAGSALVGIMLLTVVDVVLRYFGHPITGVYDLIALGGAIIIGFSIPYAADKRVHIFMEMAEFVLKHGLVKKAFYFLTRVMALCLTLIIGYNLVKLGLGYWTTGEASLTIQLPYYPIAIGLAACFFLQSIVYLAQIFHIFSGKKQ